MTSVKILPCKPPALTAFDRRIIRKGPFHTLHSLTVTLRYMYFDCYFGCHSSLLYLSRHATQSSAPPLSTAFFIFPQKKLILFSCNYLFVELHLLIFAVLCFHAGCWLAMYRGCAASQDWLIQDLVRGRQEKLTRLRRIESKNSFSVLESISLVMTMLNFLGNAQFWSIILSVLKRGL